MKLFNRNLIFLFLAFACLCHISYCARASYSSNSLQPTVKANMPVQKDPTQQNANAAMAQTHSLPKTSGVNNSNSGVDEDYLISNTQIGKIRLGMQLKEIKKLYPGATLKIVTGALDGVSSDIEVRQNGETLFYFTTNNFSEVETEELPDETDKIDFLMTNNKRFATAENIRVGQTFGNAQKVYGTPEFVNEAAYDFIVFKNAAIKSATFYNVHNEQTKTNKSYEPEAVITIIAIAKRSK